MKFDWYCQLSGSRSNSLNLQKLPGRFSYGLGTRLPHSQALVQGRRKEPGIHCLCTLSSPGDSENLCILYRITILSIIYYQGWRCCHKGSTKLVLSSCTYRQKAIGRQWKLLKQATCRRPCSVNRLTLYFDLTVYKHRQEVIIALSPQL